MDETPHPESRPSDPRPIDDPVPSAACLSGAPGLDEHGLDERGLDERGLDGLRGSVLAEEKYRQLFYRSLDAIILHDLAGNILEVNDRAVSLFGYSRAELLSLRFTDLNPTHSRHLTRTAAVTLHDNGQVRFETDLRRKSGAIFPGEISASTLDHGHDGEQLVQSTVRDVTERRLTEDRLRRSALHDRLTDLPNRTFFRDRLEVAIALARRRSGYRFAVLVVDLDRFKRINDSLGHSLGDRLLAEFARRLAGCVRDGDTVARISGDEFAVLVNDIVGLIDVRQVADLIERALREPFHLADRDLYAFASIGIALSDPLHQGPDDCLREADTALYHAKALGGGRQTVFNPGMHRRAVEQLHLETALRQATRHGELLLHYQPIVDLATGAVTELEALVRWRHPERGLLLPADFLALAEETGEIAAVDEWVLCEACRQVRRWQEQLPARRRPRLAINVSSRQFTRLEWVVRVQEALREHGIAPSSLRLEVTESAMIEEPDAAVEMLARLKAAGVRVSLDDFGTGYSSLSYLHRFPVDTLKIDRSFVSGTRRGSTILQAIVHLGHNLGMEVTAEGVETAADRERLRQLGCEYGQGYFFSPPVDADAATRQLVDGVR